MSFADALKLLVVPMSCVVAILLAIGCLGVAQLYRVESPTTATFLRRIAFGWFANAVYLQSELIALLPVPRFQHLAASEVLKQLVVLLSGIASLVFAAGSERYLQALRASWRAPLLSAAASIVVAPMLLVGAGAGVAGPLFAFNVLVNLCAILALAAAFWRLTRLEETYVGHPRMLLVWSLVGYAALQLVYFCVRAGITGRWAASIETTAFGLSLACKGGHLIGLMFLGTARIRRVTTEETRIRREEEDLRTFVGELVHELQTPASHLNLQLEQLERSILTKKNVREETRMTASVVRQIMAIVKAAYELRQPGAFTADEAPREVLNVNNVIQAAFMGVKAAVKRPRGAVSFQADYAHEPDVRGSRSRLFQLFSNIIKNSFDAFTNGRGVIRISTMRRNGHVLVTIVDDGEGINPEYLERVRERGFSTRVGPGRGNGLFIVDQVVREHGGSWEITSPVRDGRGTRITISLPAVKEDLER